MLCAEFNRRHGIKFSRIFVLISETQAAIIYYSLGGNDD
ncbi:hypothetical protein SPWS13_2089 [Shewanella putrefaciens]|nr:hypothetical protein SPWS13_2089 [Shewanella putrefaciens]